MASPFPPKLLHRGELLLLPPAALSISPSRNHLLFFTPSAPYPTFLPEFSPSYVARLSRARHVSERIPQREEAHDRTAQARTSLPSSGPRVERAGPSAGHECQEDLVAREKIVDYGARKQTKQPKDRGFRRQRQLGSYGFSSSSSGDELRVGRCALAEIADKREEKAMKTRSRKSKINTAEMELRGGLDMCSKKGDVMGAISLYNAAIGEGIKLEQYHYNVLLYLCSSAAIGVIHPAKSGNSDDVSNHNEHRRKDSIPISDDIRQYARTRGLEIFEKMCSENVPMSEAALTSVARIAMSMGNGDMAFEVVKQMKQLGITRRLRSYNPALATFCDNGDIEKAFEVEAHMLESGVIPEEPELEALLRASVVARRGDKVYYLLHKLRTNVRRVSPSTAEAMEAWFRSSTASRVGKRDWDPNTVAIAIENGGGGWHGLGWLGRGRWRVAHAHVDGDGVCLSCSQKLVTVDLDPNETVNFAMSVASIAGKRERDSNFQKFQEWLEYYGPFEAIVDAANIGLFSQRRFSLKKVNAVANAIRQKLPSKKQPLIIVHNKRLTGEKMDEPVNSKLIEKWKNADAIYPTPTGSNDDWYWLYASIKCKCLIVTNDEMRDHIFQLLGNDFFPKWKERHQVRFSYKDGSFEFQMPPPCSVVIQESEKGHWHIPISKELELERERTWLCVTRSDSKQDQTNHRLHSKDHGLC